MYLCIITIKLNQMKKALISLKKAESEFSKTIEERERVFQSRTEKWQESDKGMEYLELTMRLQDVLYQISEFNIELNEE